MNQIKEMLIDNGLEPSFQRIKIFQYLVTKKNHPTAAMIYNDLIKEIPTLSKTTVYNNLDRLVEKNLVFKFHLEENETRYDANTVLHGHFKCDRCQQVYDFEIRVEDSGLKGFEIDNRNVNYSGICPECEQR